MADTVSVEQANGTVTEQTQEARTFTQEELDSIIQARVSKERAKYSDYEALKEKASKFDEAEEASKSDLQKATERAEALQKQLDDLNRATEIRNIRDKVAQETGVPASLLNADTEDACRALADGILAFNNNSTKPVAPKVKDGGEIQNIPKSSTRDLFADFVETLRK